ncbi:hypothetical protein Cni_G23702 [Canna indica]|uniref:Uncharacterized protein n=1 Tax=Canna indica TaxID=4628 RepID=A0AAQ3KYZ9_9LILI|nr:hypothetical protein Cni_G23702 [Canna indica]
MAEFSMVVVVVVVMGRHMMAVGSCRTVVGWHEMEVRIEGVALASLVMKMVVGMVASSSVLVRGAVDSHDVEVCFPGEMASAVARIEAVLAALIWADVVSLVPVRGAVETVAYRKGYDDCS